MTPQQPPMQPVNSSMIESWAYDEQSQTLWVKFRANQKTYTYQGVDEYDWDMLKHAPSIGQAFNKFKATRPGKEVF